MLNRNLFHCSFFFTVFSTVIGLGPIMLAENPSIVVSEETTMKPSSANDHQKASASELPSPDLKTPGAVYFIPPSGWQLAQSEKVNPNVQLLVVGKGNGALPPSINLTAEPYKGTLKDYLKLVKSINDSKGNVWKDIGKIKTDAGEGSLSQVDTKIRGEDVRMMHMILAKNGVVYILTAAAMKEEFPSFYKQFFDAMSSFHINEE